MIQEILNLADKYTISYLILSEDKAFLHLPKKDLLKLLSFSIFSGEKEAVILQKQHPDSPLQHIAANLGIKIKYISGPTKDNYFFGSYSSSSLEITIDKNIILSLSVTFNHKLMNYKFTFNTIRDIFLGHEIFHHLEIIKKINLNKEFKFVNFKFGPIKFSTTAKCASEIAAFAFSQRINNLSFNPKALEYIYLIENQKCDPNEILNRLKEAKKITSSPLLNM